MSNPTPLTAARAADSAAQARAAETAAEVKRLEAEEAAAKSLGRRIAEDLVGLGGPGLIFYRDSDESLSIARVGFGLDPGWAVAWLRRTIADRIDTALAEALTASPAPAPQPAELPEGETPEAVADRIAVSVERCAGGPTAEVIADALRDYAAKAVAAERALHAARTQRAVLAEREACIVAARGVSALGNPCLTQFNNGVDAAVAAIVARKDGGK